MHDDYRNELPDDLRSLWEKLDSVPEETADSAAMKIRFNAMLDAYQETVDRSRRAWPLRPAVQFVFAVLLLVVGVAIGRYSPPPRAQQQNADLNQLRREVGDLSTDPQACRGRRLRDRHQQ